MQLPRPGDILEGKYQLEEMLGEGAYGLVVKAKTLSTNRPVAVKIMKPSKQGYTDRRAQRFMRESRVIAQLQCPNTLTLYDFGKTDAGILFMVTEYVEGEDLFELLSRRGTLSEKEALHILHQALLSLSEAHEHGVLHRDIKPHNIRLTKYGDDPLMVKVLDFGLSKTLEDEDSSTLTAAGMAVGTPRYMSPEQLSGKELTPASDIYSLGLVVYEMVISRPESPVDQTVGTRRDIKIPPDAPVSRPFRELVNRMLQRPLPERYKSASEVLAGVKAVRAGEMPPVPATASPYRPHTGGFQPVRSTEELRALPEREPPKLALYAGGLVATLAFVGIAGAVFLGGEEEPPVRVPLRPNYPTMTPMDRVEQGLSQPDDVPDPPPVVPVEADAAAAYSETCSGLEMYTPGIHRVERLSGITREQAHVLVPRGYDPTKRHGVVWAFHDFNDNAEGFLQSIRAQLKDLTEKDEQYVVVAPSAFHVAVWQKEDEIEAALAGLDVAKEHLCLDRDKLFVWAHGFGGRFGVHRAMCMPQVTAVASTSFRIREWEDLCEPQKGAVKPYIHVAATDDVVDPLNGGHSCLSNLSPNYWAPPVEKHEEFFEQRNGCRGEPRALPKFQYGECHAYTCEVPFQSCRAHGGRMLPVTENLRPICETYPSNFPYVRTLWRFFATQTRPQP